MHYEKDESWCKKLLRDCLKLIKINYKEAVLNYSCSSISE